ncbi:hypothetical protein IAT40_004091 [Kwoniella sp. CBS 6097]
MPARQSPELISLSGENYWDVGDETYNRLRNSIEQPTFEDRTSAEYELVMEEIHQYVANGTCTERTRHYTSHRFGPACGASPSERAKEVIQSTIGLGEDYYSPDAGTVPTVRASSRRASCTTDGSRVFYDRKHRLDETASMATCAAGANPADVEECNSATRWAEETLSKRELREKENGFNSGDPDYKPAGSDGGGGGGGGGGGSSAGGPALDPSTADDIKKSSSGLLPSGKRSGTAGYGRINEGGSTGYDVWNGTSYEYGTNQQYGESDQYYEDSDDPPPPYEK